MPEIHNTDYAPGSVTEKTQKEIKDILSSGAPTAISQAYAEDATGQDAYAIVYIASGQKTHVAISLGGSNDAVISFDGGATDHLVVPANSGIVLDDFLLADGAIICAKNKDAGSNYSNLRISAW